MYACYPTGVVDKEAENTSHETCTYVVKSYSICRHNVLKDFCTPVINEVGSGSKEGKFGGRPHAQKNFSCCSLFLWTVIITATVRDSCSIPMTYSRGDSKIISYTSSYMVVHLLKLPL